MRFSTRTSSRVHNYTPMSDIIQLLPDSVANQIAAGEVVQRPASVVKELLENAVDAGAGEIRLIVKDAGRTLVQVTDNGKGMTETDARMAFERHATSKITRSDDLFALVTFGFRGEALASIAAVAQVEMKTRRQEDELGTKICIEGSQLKMHEVCQCPVGTSISVKNLFFNVPARRNFLKSNSVEMRHVTDEFIRVALANPDIFFSLHHNGTETYHLPAGNSRQRAVGILGKKANEKLVPVEEETESVTFRGFVGKPSMSKKTRGEQFFFVNNRFIKSSYLHGAIMEAYEGLLPPDTYPLYVLFLQIDPKRIDINVHPTKQEIKFDDEKLIYNYLKVSVRHALGQYSITPSLDYDVEGSMSSARNFGAQGSGGLSYPASTGNFSPSDGSSAGSRSRFRPGGASAGGNEGSFTIPSKATPDYEEERRRHNNQRDWEKLYAGLDDFGSGKSTELPEGIPDSVTIDSSFGTEVELDSEANTFGQARRAPYQIHGTYIVSQIKSGFLLIDQQAAHERILYERYLAAWNEEPVSTQQALFPEEITVSPTDGALLRGILEEIRQLGFDIRQQDMGTFQVHGVPADDTDMNAQSVLETLLEQYKSNLDLQLDTRENIARSLARSAATKRGQQLDDTEMQVLIDQLFACAVPFRSPNGRQCFVTYDLKDLDRMFG